MGCGLPTIDASQQRKEQQKMRMYKNVGSIQIKIIGINYMQKVEKNLLKTDNYIKVSLSNQIHVIPLHHNFGNAKQIVPERTELNFHINRNDSQRFLEIETFRRQESRGVLRIGYSRQRINELIQRYESENNSVRSLELTNCQGQKIAWAKISSQFTPLKYQILAIQINSVTLRSKAVKERKVYVRFEIGEQIFQSASAIQTSKSLPSWSNALHQFVIPQRLTEGIIQVYQKMQFQNADYLLGQLKFDLALILRHQGLQLYSQQISVNEQSTGSIKIQFLKVQNQLLQNVVMESPKNIVSKNNEDKTKIICPKIIQFKTKMNKLRDDEPTTNFSDGKQPRDQFSIFIKKENHSQLNLPKKQHKRTPNYSNPFQYKHYNLNEQTKVQPILRNQLIKLSKDQKKQQENPQSFNQIQNLATLNDKIKNSRVYDQDIPQIDLLKTVSMLIQNQQKNIQLKIQTEVIELRKSKLEQKESREQPKMTIEQGQMIIGKTKCNITIYEDAIQPCSLKGIKYCRTAKLMPQIVGDEQEKGKINLGLKQNKSNSQQNLKLQKLMELQKKQENPQSKPTMGELKNSKVRILLDDCQSEFDYSLPEESNRKNKEQQQ